MWMIAFRTLYAFQGNPAAQQLSFEAGVAIIVTDPSKADVNGWGYGHFANNPNIRGWFPLTYVLKQHQQISPNPAPVAAAPPPPTPSSSKPKLNALDSWGSPQEDEPSSSASASASSWLGTPSTKTSSTASNGLPSWAIDPVHNTGSSNHDDDDDGGFGGGLMGGDWKGSNAMSSGSGFGSSAAAIAGSDKVQQSQAVVVAPSYTSPAATARNQPQQQQQRRFGAGLGNRFARAASRTGSTISNAAGKTASATKAAFQETGHRFRDMEEQHQKTLNQTAPSHATTQTNKNGNQMYETNVVSGGGVLPGRRSDTVTSVQKSGGVTTTTKTTTSRASGGFMPFLPGKTVTTETTTRDRFGNTMVHTQQERKGGLYIIPLGPIGLAACGVLAAKNAIDAHNDRQKASSQQEN